jgi:hypothetical protein
MLGRIATMLGRIATMLGRIATMLGRIATRGEGHLCSRCIGFSVAMGNIQVFVADPEQVDRSGSIISARRAC